MPVGITSLRMWPKRHVTVEPRQKNASRAYDSMRTELTRLADSELGGEYDLFSPFLCQRHRFSPLPLCQATREASCRRWTLWVAGGGSN